MGGTQRQSEDRRSHNNNRAPNAHMVAPLVKKVAVMTAQQQQPVPATILNNSFSGNEGMHCHYAVATYYYHLITWQCKSPSTNALYIKYIL